MSQSVWLGEFVACLRVQGLSNPKLLQIEKNQGGKFSVKLEEQEEPAATSIRIVDGKEEFSIRFDDKDVVQGVW